MGLISNATTIFDAGAINVGGSMTFIKKLTASGSANLTFVNGSSDVVFDSTYKEYIFTFKNIHPATDNKQLTVGFRDGATAYDAPKMATLIIAYHNEDDGGADTFYSSTYDLGVNDTNYAVITSLLSANEADACAGGYLHIFNPASGLIKNYFGVTSSSTASNEASQDLFSGYINTTTAIDAVQFKMSSGNIDAGDICLYGIK